MVIVGFNIASFKLKKIVKTGSIFPVALMILKVAVPTVVYTALLHFVFGPFTWQNLLLIGNFFTERNPNGFGYWFIEVYVQIQCVLMALLAVPAVRQMATSNIRLTSYLFVISSSSIMLVCISVWDTSQWHDRLPWLLLWAIAFGFAARFSENLIDRILLVCAFTVLSLFYMQGISWVLILGYALLVFNPGVRLPVGVSTVVNYIAAGSLFIYLTHFQFASAVEKLMGPSPWVSAIVALTGGATLFHIYNRVINKPVTANLRNKGYVV
ncbi:MAG TPA: hypothetical protein VIC26_05935 [Marinagarivorans sp.]